MKKLLARWQANFLTGLAIILPAVVSIVLLVWLFGLISNITDHLLIFLPKEWTRDQGGQLRWYWSLFAFILAIFIIGAIGKMGRHYIGRKMIQLVDLTLLKVPLLNKIYSATKQINATFASSEKAAFKQVVLVEFPRPGIYSLGFLTGEEHPEIQEKTGEKIVSVVIPTAPNPTTGYLVLLPSEQVYKLDMSVMDGMKFVLSLGAIAPPYQAPLVAVKMDDISAKTAEIKGADH